MLILVMRSRRDDSLTNVMLPTAIRMLLQIENILKLCNFP